MGMPTVVQTFSDGTQLLSDGTVIRPNYPQAGQDTFDTVGVLDVTDSLIPNVNLVVVPATFGALSSGELTKSGNGVSSIAIFSDLMRSIGLSLLLVSAGSARVQYTYDSVLNIQNGNDSTINWFDWSKGIVSASTSLWDNCPRAIRLYVTSGTWRLNWKATKT